MRTSTHKTFLTILLLLCLAPLSGLVQTAVALIEADGSPIYCPTDNREEPSPPQAETVDSSDSTSLACESAAAVNNQLLAPAGPLNSLFRQRFHLRQDSGAIYHPPQIS